MAFASDEVKQKVKELILQEKKTKEILAVVVNGCNSHDVSNLRFTLKHAGSAKPPVRGLKHKKAKAGDNKKFLKALDEEIKSVAGEKEKLERLIVLYDKQNAGFAIFLEPKLKSVTDKLDLLLELQSN